MELILNLSTKMHFKMIILGKMIGIYIRPGCPVPNVKVTSAFAAQDCVVIIVYGSFLTN